MKFFIRFCNSLGWTAWGFSISAGHEVWGLLALGLWIVGMLEHYTRGDGGCAH